MHLLCKRYAAAQEKNPPGRRVRSNSLTGLGGDQALGSLAET
jgi:hypothetical protein